MCSVPCAYHVQLTTLSFVRYVSEPFNSWEAASSKCVSLASVNGLVTVHKNEFAGQFTQHDALRMHEATVPTALDTVASWTLPL